MKSSVTQISKCSAKETSSRRAELYAGFDGRPTADYKPN